MFTGLDDGMTALMTTLKTQFKRKALRTPHRTSPKKNLAKNKRFGFQTVQTSDKNDKLRLLLFSGTHPNFFFKNNEQLYLDLLEMMTADLNPGQPLKVVFVSDAKSGKMMWNRLLEYSLTVTALKKMKRPVELVNIWQSPRLIKGENCLLTKRWAWQLGWGGIVGRRVKHEECKKAMLHAHVLYVGGGNPKSLLDIFTQRYPQTWTEVKDNILKGRCVWMSWSAGTCVAGEHVVSTQMEPRIAPGLSLTKFTFRPHLTANNFPSFELLVRELLADGYPMNRVVWMRDGDVAYIWKGVLSTNGFIEKDLAVLQDRLDVKV